MCHNGSLSSLQTRATEYHLRHQVTDVLDTMVDAGLTVLRTWAFNDGNEWNALQPEPGKHTPALMLPCAQHIISIG
jgi:mannan endo-1,4-beta-mannosidase